MDGWETTELTAYEQKVSRDRRDFGYSFEVGKYLVRIGAVNMYVDTQEEVLLARRRVLSEADSGFSGTKYNEKSGCKGRKMRVRKRWS